MPRERSFSEPEVVEQIADVFSVHGFGGTSMALLQEATGLGKQSLYNTFGDKAAMYRQAVDCAVARYDGLVRSMQQAPSGRAAIQVFFDSMVGRCTAGRPADQRCIVTSGLLEGLDDAAMHAELERKWLATHELLRAEVERGQRDASIRNRLPSAALADQLMLVVSGLRVMARVQPLAPRLSDAAAHALAMLDSG